MWTRSEVAYTQHLQNKQQKHVWNAERCMENTERSQNNIYLVYKTVRANFGLDHKQ